MRNVILTPHIGGSTQESQENIGREVAEKLVRFALSGTTKGAVNFPEVPYQPAEGSARILHVHRNEPGALALLNAVFAERKINICSQQLQTKGPIGYVLTDIGNQADAALMDALRALPMTVRCDLL